MTDVVHDMAVARIERPAFSVSAYKPVLLATPAFLFVLILFVVPIMGFLYKSIDNSEINTVLPRTTQFLSHQWQPSEDLPNEIYGLLVDELSAAEDVQVSALARRLNYELPEFRRLIMRTRTAMASMSKEDAKAGLLAAVPQWQDKRYWQILRNSSGRFTSFYYLTALDLKKDADGSITNMPAEQRQFRQVITRTFTQSVFITLICLLIAYPVANALAKATPRRASLMMFCILLPFWTSLLVRTSAWILLLQRQGLLNNVLSSLGLIDAPLPMIFNALGVYITMVHVMLPFAILPLYAAMRRISPMYLRAATSLGANPVRAFFEIYVPQTYPAIAASGTMVLVLVLGYYVTPSLVGGPADQMIGTSIAYFTNVTLNWGLAAALSVILLVMTFLLFAILALAFGKARSPASTSPSR
ncbi:ABC transporter permease [Rhizobium sp. 2MFCol3.1]|uniref:ABC transporter permease n=1 Tax=Rhizobium sp. 2MFCol3.1 TaxID=1246459 RepID=UPI00037BDC6C|nr:ABC transporter permease [Rhizobium sp. 2MFCol3.1]